MHRQTAMAAIQHMALGVAGFGCEDALTHLLNYVWPNIFETSPHVVQAFMGAVEGLRVAVGSSKILQYTLQVKLKTLFLLALLIKMVISDFEGRIRNKRCFLLPFSPPTNTDFN